MYHTPVFKLSQNVHMFIKNIGDYLFDGILLLNVIRKCELKDSTLTVQLKFFYLYFKIEIYERKLGDSLLTKTFYILYMQQFLK